MATYNAAVQAVPMPERIQRLPVDERGFPVPWFAAIIDGKPDFRVVEPTKFGEALAREVCWVCGDKLGRHRAFVVGPMCAVNRTTSEPPCHTDCAEFAAKACPFLVQPRMRRNDKGLPGSLQDPPGKMLTRNPGVALVWVTKFFELFRAGNGVLITLGEPENVSWWAQGRPATREEVQASIDSGYPALAELAAKEKGGMDELARRMNAVARLLTAVA